MREKRKAKSEQRISWPRTRVQPAKSSSSSAHSRLSLSLSPLERSPRGGPRVLALLMTALPSRHRPLPTVPSQSPDRKDTYAASTLPPPVESRAGVVSSWRRKLRSQGDAERHEPINGVLATEPKRKRASFIKALFKHDRHAIPTATKPPESNQTLERPRPATPQTTARWHDLNGAVAVVGGRRVPFSLAAHRRLCTKRARALASIDEAQPTRSSAEAYRRRAYYHPGKPAKPKKDSEGKAKKPQTRA